MKALVGAFNKEKALVGAFSVIVKTDGSIAALTETVTGTSVANVLSAPQTLYKPPQSA